MSLHFHSIVLEGWQYLTRVIESNHGPDLVILGGTLLILVDDQGVLPFGVNELVPVTVVSPCPVELFFSLSEFVDNDIGLVKLLVLFLVHP